MLAFNHLGRMGQLGNQMFQFAAVKGIARHRGYDFMIPKHEVTLSRSGNKNGCELFLPFEPNVDNIGMFQTENFIIETHFHFSQELFDTCQDNASLAGYFQTPKYFNHIEDEIRKDFTFKDEIKDPCESMIEILNKPIALHIRRGDYINHAAHMYNQKLDYYKDALEYFGDDRQILIFSNDTKWCKEQEMFQESRFFMSESGSSYSDMCLMSLCHSFIIANSTFSWWPAFLATNEDKKVIYPKQWFSLTGYAKDYNVSDLFPEEWIKL